MKTYVFAIQVVQSGESARDARMILSGNLGTILEPEDFEVAPMPVSLETRRFVGAVVDAHYAPEPEEILPWLEYVPADKRDDAQQLYELYLKEELDDVDCSPSNWQEVNQRNQEIIDRLGHDTYSLVHAHFRMALRSVTHYASGKPYVYEE